MVSNLSLEGRLPGHAGALTPDQVAALKKLWSRLFELFKQTGEPYTPPATTDSDASSQASSEKQEKKNGGGGWFGFGKSSAPAKEVQQDKPVFLGKTADPRWMSLTLEEAIKLIPGDQLERTFWHMVATDNPDACVLRFLRARKWDVDAAYRMIINTLRWRLHNRVDDITKLGETGLVIELNKLKPKLGDDFIRQIKCGKATLGGPDKSDRGICFLNVQLHHKEDQPFEAIQIAALYLMETARVFCGYPMVNACLVFNLENFTLANMDFDFVKFLITCLERYYPETLGLCLIHKAPWVFSTVWAMIQPLLDPVVAAKIKFSKNLDELQEHIDIGSVPVIISGNPDRKTKDEATKADDPAAGILEVPTSAEYLAYEEEKKAYTQVTEAWAKSEIVAGQEDQDALARLERGRQYRLARIRAEKDLRANTTYHQKGLLKLTSDAHLYVDFGGDNWVEQDITDRV